MPESGQTFPHAARFTARCAFCAPPPLYYVAHNIVTGILGGRIELQSAPGKGTVFTLVLPTVAPRTVEAI